MKKRYRLIKSTLWNDELDFRAHIFNTLGLLGVVLGVGLGLYYVFTPSGVLNILGNFGAAAAAVVILAAANRHGDFKRFFLLTVILVFLIIFPVLFFAGGGYHSGMPSFFVFAVVFTVIMLEGRQRAVFTLLEFALYLGCFLTAYYHPGTVKAFPTEVAVARDIIIGCMASATVLAIAIYRHMVIYDRKMRELERANGALHGVSHMKTEFLQNISHELRTPLSNMINYALDTLHELDRAELSVPEMQFNQGRIRAEGERLIRMVNQLLDVTAIEAGRQQMRTAPVALAGLISRAVDAGRAAIAEHGNRVELSIAEGLPEVFADADYIERVLANLISNAARHTRGGVITLSLTAGAGRQEVCVADTGEGMPQAVLDQVFLRYIERESTVTGRSGMGLYICKKLIDAHGGGIGITSGQRGTAVRFWLPEHRGGDGNE